MNRDLIEQYAKGAGAVGEAIAGLKREDFLAYPVPGTWSIQQIVIHLMDSDLIGADRMKRVIAEELPLIIGYNETAFSQKLSYDKMDPFAAAEVFKRHRELMVVALRNLPDEAFARAGIHNERGKVTLEQFLKGYIDHLEHHLKFLREKRKLLGK